jgi:ribose/xylose/arabinose/galactoside ABC-type transport system permease subunit
MVEKKSNGITARAKGLLRRPAASVTIAWIVLVVVMLITSPSFGTWNNIVSIATNVSVLAILSMGMMFVMVSGGIDLSLGSLLGLSGVIIYLLAGPLGLPIWLAALLGVAFSTAVGLLITGTIIAKTGLPAFVVTLGGLVAFAGLAGVLTGGRTNTLVDIGIVGWLGSGTIGPVPVAPLVMIVVFAITTWILRATWLGRELYAVGGNQEAARLSGVNVVRIKMIAYGLAGMFAGVAAVVQIGRFRGAVPPTAGSGMELVAIAALLLGGVALSGGSGSAGGAFVGVLFLATVQNALDLLGVSNYWKDVVTGSILVIAMMLTTIRRSKKNKRTAQQALSEPLTPERNSEPARSA